MAQRSYRLDLARSHVHKLGLQRLSLWTGRNLSKPTGVFASITNRCNLHCRQCDIPLTGDRRRELSTSDWRGILMELRQWLGTALVRWSGGEPFVRKDMVDLIEYSSQIGILTGLNTNGHFIDEKVASRLAEADVFNVNISLDGMEASHDLVRGKGQFQRATAAARLLNAKRRQTSSRMKIVLKVTIMQANLDDLLTLADWVANEGLDGLSISPLEETFSTANPNARWFESSPLWVKDIAKLDRVIDRLIERTGSRGPVFNSVSHLKAMKSYYRDPLIPLEPDFSCHVGRDHFRINFDGGVVMCPFMNSIGNLMQSGPREIWRSAEANERRSDIAACRRKCLLACLYRRSLREHLDLLAKLL